jgi:hypothetical protein
MEQNEAIIRALSISKENKMVFPQSKYPWTNDAAIVDKKRRDGFHGESELKVINI